MNRPDLLVNVPIGVQTILEATQELREAKEILRRGNVIRGVQRHERAKSALYLTMTAPTDASILIRQADLERALGEHPLREQVLAFLQAGREFHEAYGTSRTHTTDSRAALDLVRAEKKLISELDQLERLGN